MMVPDGQPQDDVGIDDALIIALILGKARLTGILIGRVARGKSLISVEPGDPQRMLDESGALEVGLPEQRIGMVV